MAKRIQFNFTEETYAAIHHLKEITGQTTMAGVIRDALRVYAWIIGEQRGGRKFYSKDPRNPNDQKELVPLTKI